MDFKVIVGNLRKEHARLTGQLNQLEKAMAALIGFGGNGVSEEARRKMSLAQKARWAKAANSVTTTKPKRTMSAAARRKIAAFQRARWAKLKAGKKAA